MMVIMDSSALEPALEPVLPLPGETAVSAADTVTVLVCVKVQGQSVTVKEVASVIVYVAPLVLKVVGFGQYVVNSVTISVEVTTAVETGLASSVFETVLEPPLEPLLPLPCGTSVSAVVAMTVLVCVKVQGQSVIVREVASVTV